MMQLLVSGMIQATSQDFETIPGANHFTIMEQMASVDGVLTRSIRKMLLGEAHGS